MCAHNPVHDFLDMALSAIGGGKRARGRYKKEKQRAAERKNRTAGAEPLLYDRKGAHRIQPGMKLRPDPPEHFHEDEVPIARQRPRHRPTPPSQGGHYRGGLRGARSLSNVSGASEPTLKSGSLASGSRSTSQIDTGGSRRVSQSAGLPIASQARVGSAGRAVSGSRAAPQATVGRNHGSQSASNHGSMDSRIHTAAPINIVQSQHHVRTAVAPIGNMERTYIEGMVLGEEFRAREGHTPW